jgi:tRNA dimethylallyltransferase
MKKPVLFIVGPTAVGKTALSLELAKKYNGEIISGDSMQVYRGMDIGTAKASPEERAEVPHHLIDICDPSESFTVSMFQTLAAAVIADIHARGKLPIVVGGTGLYVESLCYDFGFAEGEPNLAVREALQARIEQEGSEVLHRELAKIDPQAAEKIHANDARRIIRALEVWQTTGTTFSAGSTRKESPYEPIWIGLNMDRAKLYERIEMRIDQMLNQGLVEEVKTLLLTHASQLPTALQAIGYKEIVRWLQGEYTYERAVELLKRDTRHFAKRQLSWFRRMVEIHWVDCTNLSNFNIQIESISAIMDEKFI